MKPKDNSMVTSFKISVEMSQNVFCQARDGIILEKHEAMMELG